MANEKEFEARAVLGNGVSVAAQSAAVGLFVSAAQNAFASHSAGAWGVFTRTGTTVGIFTAVGATYAMTEAAVANVRHKDDVYNEMAGGCAAGFLAGVRAKSISAAIGSCALLGGAMGAFELTKGLKGNNSDETPEERRKRFFKPGKEPPMSPQYS